MNALRSAIGSGLAALGAHPLRTTLSTLGIIIGVAALVAVLALGDGVERFARDQIEQTTDLQIVTIEPRVMETVNGVRIRRTDPPRLTLTEIDALRERLSTLGHVMATTSRSARVRMTASGGLLPAVVTAVSGMPSEGDRAPIAGRALSNADSSRAVINTRLARGLSLPPDSAIGRTLEIGGDMITIIGVVEGPETSPPQVFVPLTPETAAAADQLTVVLVADVVEDVQPLRGAAERWLERRYGDVNENFAVSSHSLRLQQATQAIMVFKLLMGSITLISVLVGGIGIMNILLASVTERTREIGIRKATGARKWDILLQFLSESIAISGLGGALGLGLGYLIAGAAAAVMRDLAGAALTPAFTPVSLVIVAAVAILVGVVFGTYPAMRAARLAPVDAMRYE